MKVFFYLFILATTTSFVSASENAILHFVSAIDWETESLEVVGPGSDEVAFVRIEYEGEGVWKKQTDDWDVGRCKKWVYGDPIKPYWGYGKGSGRPGELRTGVARPKKFSKDGFMVVFSLRWLTESKGSGEFKEEFTCDWLPVQTFEKDGFKIRVTLKPKE